MLSFQTVANSFSASMVSDIPMESKYLCHFWRRFFKTLFQVCTITQFLCVCVFVFLLSQEVSGVGPRVQSSKVSSEGDGETGSVILGISDRLVSAMVQSGQNQTKTTVKSPTVGKMGLFCFIHNGSISNQPILTLFCVLLDLSLETIGPGNFKGENTLLSTNMNSMEINLENMAANNNGEKKKLISKVIIAIRHSILPFPSVHPQVLQQLHS